MSGLLKLQACFGLPKWQQTRNPKRVWSDKHSYLSCKPARQFGFLRKCCYVLRRVGGCHWWRHWRSGQDDVEMDAVQWSHASNACESTWPAGTQLAPCDPQPFVTQSMLHAGCAAWCFLNCSCQTQGWELGTCWLTRVSFFKVYWWTGTDACLFVYHEATVTKWPPVFQCDYIPFETQFEEHCVDLRLYGSPFHCFRSGRRVRLC